MFQLAAETDPRWAGVVLEHLDELLLEHAHLERKAAQSALQFMVRYPDRVAFQRPLSELAREELGHFEAVLAVMESRGVRFGPQRASRYAARLLEVVRRDEPFKLLDRLLCAAVIEARSCERLKLLAQGLREAEPELAQFYAGLVQSEARHYTQYVAMAEQLECGEDVPARLGEICAHEAAILGSAPGGPRMHNAYVQDSDDRDDGEAAG